MIKTTNPATGKALQEYRVHAPGEVQERLERGDRVFTEWSGRSVEERARLVGRAGEILRQRQHDLAVLITREMGKPISQSSSEIEKCAWVCDYYAENGPGFLADEQVSTEYDRSYVLFQPLGLILAVMPWNFPFWQVFRFAAPALTAGNTAVLKHASNVMGCALAIEEVFTAAGLPEGVFQSLVLPSDRMEAVIENPLVRAVTLTGSEPAGKAVASCAARQVKKSVLELGGSDPYLVLEDADLELAAAKCVASRLNNGGQTCIAAKRFIVQESVREEFESRLIHEMSAYPYGDPMRGNIQLGPLARDDLRRDLHQQVTTSIGQGARLLLGGRMPESSEPGFYYPATLLTAVRPGMPAFDEETFGPVGVVVAAADEKDAVALANQSSFGLGAAVFSRDLARAERIAGQLQAGCVFINDFVKSDPRMPFGGVRNSGYGRELSRYGILEFVNIKSVVGQES